MKQIKDIKKQPLKFVTTTYRASTQESSAGGECKGPMCFACLPACTRHIYVSFCSGSSDSNFGGSDICWLMPGGQMGGQADRRMDGQYIHTYTMWHSQVCMYIHTYIHYIHTYITYITYIHYIHRLGSIWAHSCSKQPWKSQNSQESSSE